MRPNSTHHPAVAMDPVEKTPFTRDHTPTGCLLHRSYVIELEDGRQIAARPRNVRDAASAVEEAGDRLDELEKELDEMEAALDAEEQEQEQEQ